MPYLMVEMHQVSSQRSLKPV